MLNSIGKAISDFDLDGDMISSNGKVLVRGEIWKAKVSGSDLKIKIGEEIQVVRVDGATLTVKKVKSFGFNLTT